MEKFFKNNSIPKFDLNLNGNPDCLTWKNSENNETICVATYVDDPKGSIYGNFCKFVSDFPYETPSKLETKSKELMYTGESSGSFKKVYIGLRDHSSREFIVTDEPLIRKSFNNHKEQNFFNPRFLSKDKKTIEEKLEFIKNEITTQQDMHLKCPKIVPKIYSANIYVAKIQVDENCDPEYEIRFQMLMERADVNGFKFINNYLGNNMKLLDFYMFEPKFQNPIFPKIRNFIKHFRLLAEYSTDQPIPPEDEDRCFSFIMNNKYYIETWSKKQWVWLCQLFRAMKCIHDNGYIHNDIKGDNFATDLVYNNIDNDKSTCENVKIIDFGLAKKIEYQKQLLEETKENYIKSVKSNRNLEEYEEKLIQAIEFLFQIPPGYENHPMMLEMYDVDTRGYFYSRFMQNSLFFLTLKELIIDYYIIPLTVLQIGRSVFDNENKKGTYVNVSDRYIDSLDSVFTNVLDKLDIYNNYIIPEIKVIQIEIVSLYNEANNIN